MLPRENRRPVPAINASSMADIAFLLLIFFLVSTEIPSEAGILVRLPRYESEPPPPLVLADRNVFTVLVNGGDEVLLEGSPARRSDIGAAIKAFVTNPTQSDERPANPRSAVVSLRNDRSTTYRAYLEVYNELQRGYRELWDEEAQARYGLPYLHVALSDSLRKSVRAAIPMTISEAEPTDYDTVD